MSSWIPRRAPVGALTCSLLTAACTDPAFSAQDGGADAEQVGGDASAASDARALPLHDGAVDSQLEDAGGALPPELARFVGHYAVRTFFYAVDGLIQPLSELHSIVRIEPSAGGLRMVEKACAAHTEWALHLGLVIEAQGTVSYPDDMPERVFALDVQGDSFNTDAPLYLTGYMDAAPADCAAGEQQAQAPADSWVDGTCDCPLDPNEPPPAMNVTDCRITDPDHDGHPGMTVQARFGDPPSNLELYVVQRSRDRFLNARLAPGGRILANFALDSELSVLACDQTSSSCELGVAKPCPSGLSTSEFIPVEAPEAGAWTCAEVFSQTLFSGGAPDFPPACQ